MATAVRRAGVVPPMGYRYPSRYRHDTRPGAQPRGMPIAVTFARPVQARRPWAIALERQVRFGWNAARAGAAAGTFMALYTVPALMLLTDQSPFAGVYAAAAPLVGRRPLELATANGFHADPGALLAGLAVYGVLGAAWAVLFGAVVRGGPRELGWLLPRGLLFALAALAATGFTLPELQPSVGWPVLVFAHLLFGALLAWWPLLRPGDFARRPRLRVVSRR